ncbi:MAG TPA: hypothetical protein DER09_10415 [Prolixibacteraceae bacterium]|nr:hypothetical protein [Prolixibacteraceae bacterium]
MTIQNNETTSQTSIGKIMVLLMFFLVPVFAFAQTEKNKNDKYFPGGIISLNNDTVAAKILLENITKMQKQVKFIDAGGKKKSFKPDMINGFFLEAEDEKMIFESRDDINLTAFPSNKGYFYYRISNDAIPLYYFVTTKMANTGVESQMEEVQNYVVKKDFRWYLYTKENYEDCVKIFEDNRMLVNDIKNGKYTFAQFPEIVKRYCSSMQQ